eukprot:TRINITY_DN922_c0_g1_i2.p1 TRINITY_DN922_c0_g1~~TRINITY_DN922_c0_g1_i2.p1  ORF type:complete len:680 (+),score=111.23 TRINITY_DN922_c0_g1_i2:89-2041(+)
MVSLLRLTILTILAFVGVFQQDCPAPCHDVEPDESGLPCDFYVMEGQCSDDIMKYNGEFVFCYCSCGRCKDGVTPPELPESQDLGFDVGNFAVAAGEAVSTAELVSTCKEALTSASVILTKEDFKNAQNSDEKTQKIADAAAETTRVVSTAIAKAFAATSISAVTKGDNSAARGRAIAVAESVATATAGAYAETLSAAGDDVVALQTETFATDIKTTLVSSYTELSISGDSIANVANQAIGRAVAEVVAIATASAYARIAGGDEQAVGRATTQALTSDELDCPSVCNNNPPGSEFTCEQEKGFGKCSEAYMAGFCECTCATCTTGAEATTSTTAELQTSGEEEASITALGNAFAEGAKGGDAIAKTLVDISVQGDVQVIVDAIAQAYGGGEIPTSAIADSLVQAINLGGDEVMAVIAEAFASAQPGQQLEAISEVIQFSFTINRPVLAGTCASILIVAYEQGGCPSIQDILDKARMQSNDKSTFDETTKKQGVPCSKEAEDTIEIEDQLAMSLAANDIATATSNLVKCVRGWVSVPSLVGIFNKAVVEKSVSCFAVTSVVKGCLDVVTESPKLVSLVKRSIEVENCMTSDMGICGKPVFGDVPCCGSSSFPLECDCTRMGCRSFYQATKSIPQLGLQVYQTVTGDCYCDI